MGKTFLQPIFIGKVLDDIFAMEEYMKTQAEHLDYTVVRPPGLKSNSHGERLLLICTSWIHVLAPTELPIFACEVYMFPMEKSTMKEYGIPAIARGDVAR